MTIPAFLHDLAFDRLVGEITAGRTEYTLDDFFRRPAATVEIARYRQAVMRDLDDPAILMAIGRFSEAMRQVRRDGMAGEKLRHRLQRERLFLDTADHHVAAVARFAADLAACRPRSAGLIGFRRHIADHVASAEFADLVEEIRGLRADLAAVRSMLLLEADGIAVRPFASEADYAAEIEATFGRFGDGDGTRYDFGFSEGLEMDHVEGGVLDLVAACHPEVFARLARFSAERRDFADPTILRFDREVQVYLACLDHIAPLRRVGLCFCLPDLTDDEEVFATDTFDLVLARDLVAADLPVVTNDLRFLGSERILVVSGTNQGGKTTFARAFGQIHHLARLGLPVPGRSARLRFADAIFTHFERADDLGDLRSRLEDDLVRIHALLAAATDRSVVVLNEIFSSTTTRDAVVLGRRVLEALAARGALCVCVTFLDELSRLGPWTASLVATVDDADPTVRTHRIVRRPADGRSHAISVAAKYGLTLIRVKERLAR